MLDGRPMVVAEKLPLLWVAEKTRPVLTSANTVFDQNGAPLTSKEPVESSETETLKPWVVPGADFPNSGRVKTN